VVISASLLVKLLIGSLDKFCFRLSLSFANHFETMNALLSGIVGGFAQVDRFTSVSVLCRTYGILIKLGFHFVLSFD
jgi:hypothetical protein